MLSRQRYFWGMLLASALSCTEGYGVTRLVWPPYGSFSSTDTTYDTIKEAVDAANANDTIQIVGLANPYTMNSGGEPSAIVVSKAGLHFLGYDYQGNEAVIDGNFNNNSSNTPFRVTAQNVTFENITFKNSRWGAFDFQPGADNGKILSCVFDGNHRFGGQIRANDIEVEDTYFINTVEHPAGSKGGHGVHVRNADNCTFTDCHAHNNSWDGFSIRDYDNCTLDTCHSYENGRQGVQTQDVEHLTIDGGSYYENDATGIQIEDGSYDVVIRNVEAKDNTSDVFGGGESGIWIDDASDVVVEDSSIFGNQLGFNITRSSNVIIRFNYVYDNSVNHVSAPSGGSLKYNHTDRLAVYHNTFWNNGSTDSGQNGAGSEKGYDRGGFGVVLGTPGNSDDVTQSLNTEITFVNNILGSINGLVGAHTMQFYSTAEISDLDHNVYYEPPVASTASYHVKQAGTGKFTFSGYQAISGIDEDNSVEATVSPIVNTTSFAPAGDAVNSASELATVTDTDTTVNGGSFVEVTNASYFRIGDVVKTNWGVTANVTDVDYANNEIEVDDTAYETNVLYLDRTGNSGVDIGCAQN